MHLLGGRIELRQTYQLFSVDRDEVSCGFFKDSMSSYANSLKTDLVALRSNDIGPIESISAWITSNSFPYNALSAYCITTDNAQVCVVKFTREDGNNKAVKEVICGDQLQ